MSPPLTVACTLHPASHSGRATIIPPSGGSLYRRAMSNPWR